MNYNKMKKAELIKELEKLCTQIEKFESAGTGLKSADGILEEESTFPQRILDNHQKH